MSRQRHGGLGLAWSAVPMRAGAGNGVTTGTSVGWLGQGGEGARALGERGAVPPGGLHCLGVAASSQLQGVVTEIP